MWDASMAIVLPRRPKRTIPVRKEHRPPGLPEAALLYDDGCRELKCRLHKAPYTPSLPGLTPPEGPREKLGMLARISPLAGPQDRPGNENHYVAVTELLSERTTRRTITRRTTRRSTVSLSRREVETRVSDGPQRTVEAIVGVNLTRRWLYAIPPRPDRASDTYGWTTERPLPPPSTREP